MSNETEPKSRFSIPSITLAQVAIGIAIAALLVNAPRLVIAFLEGDGLSLYEPIEGALLMLTGIASGVVLSGGGAFIAHKIGMIRGFNPRNPLHVALLVIWSLMLIFSVVIIAPIMVQGIRASGLKDVLSTDWQQWAWGIVSVAAPEVLAAGAMIAAALESQPNTADDPTPQWQLTLETFRDDLTAALLKLTESVESTVRTATERDTSLNQQLTALTTNISDLTQTIAHQAEASTQSATDLNATLTTLNDRVATLGQLLTTNHKSTSQSTAALAEGLKEVHTALGDLSSQLEAPKLTHVCPDCGKGFTSANGLGGHRSSCPMRNIPALLNGNGGNHG